MLDLLSRMTLATLALACACAWAQAPQQPGPMQSGRHAAKEPTTDAAAGGTPPVAGAGTAGLDGNQLFATSCGWCHFKGGRENGKGPKLMGTPLTDAEIVSRIKSGKTGSMPAFGSTFSDDQLRAIVGYIRELKP